MTLAQTLVRAMKAAAQKIRRVTHRSGILTGKRDKKAARVVTHIVVVEGSQ